MQPKKESRALSLSVFVPSALTLFYLIILAFVLEPLAAQFLKAHSLSNSGRTSMSIKLKVIGFAVVFMSWIFPSIARRIRNFYNGVPGPRLAKLTIFWKLYHSYKGTYAKRIKELHEKHGEVVQVGPTEYSIGSSRAIASCRQLKKIASPLLSLLPLLDPPTLKILSETLSMANIFHYEPSVDQCNFEFLNKLCSSAQRGEEVNMADLVARYAWDMLFTTTVGKSPGFLQQSNVSKLQDAMEQWKFNAILDGSYLRFHPIITRALQLCGFGESVTRPVADQLESAPENDAPCVYNDMRKASDDQPFQSKEVLEACIALMVSGSDPVMTHILASIFFTYENPTDLVEALRSEIANANLGQPPTLKELIHAKPRMPLLHAVLQESRRLCQTANNHVSYVAPKGGVDIIATHVPEGCTICLETSVAHVNPDIFGVDASSFDPKRWLGHPAAVRNLRSHMVTFGAAGDLCPGEELHLSIVAKIFTQVVCNFDIAMSSVVAFQSPVDDVFNEIKGHYYAKVSLPKATNINNNVPVSPLRATAPAFAPETTTAPEFPPGLTPMKMTFAQAEITEGSCKAVGSYVTRIGSPKASAEETNQSLHETALTSPTLSIATTVNSSSVSSITPLTWLDEQKLEDLLGRPATNELISRFDPTAHLKPGAPLKTRPLSTGHERYQLHEILERVWCNRLIHETSRRDNCMYIWVPGSKVPKWLSSTHQRRQANDRKKAATGKPAPVHVASVQQHADPIKAPREANAVWTNFAVDENVRYDSVAKLSGDEYVAMVTKKAEEAGMKKDEYVAPTFKETFKLTGGDQTKATSTVAKAAEDGPKKVTVPPHLRPRMALPPHLRPKASAADDTVDEAKANNEERAWVAAKLPFTSSTDSVGYS